MFDVSRVLLKLSSTALDALEVIDNGAAQIALVVDDRLRLVGTLTDGDVRRALLHGETLDAQVVQLMNRNFRYVKCSDDKDSILEMMRRRCSPDPSPG